MFSNVLLCAFPLRSAVTENTRASYPIDHIPNARIPCVGPHPKNLILLCCDAFGVLPPVSRLTKEQAMYHFISGYTAKVHGHPRLPDILLLSSVAICVSSRRLHSPMPCEKELGPSELLLGAS